jgi:hypothetical protein
VIGFRILAPAPNGLILCVQIQAAGSSGKIDCDGGTPVGVVTVGDSHGTGANDPAVVLTGLGAPGVAGDAYVTATVRQAVCPSAACIGTVATAADCATLVDFTQVAPVPAAFTTGTATANILNADGAVPGALPLVRTGLPFSCATWTTTNASGTVVSPAVTYGPDVAAIVYVDD